MKSYHRLLKKLPGAMRRSQAFHIHMAARPSGVPRQRWVRDFARAHGFLAPSGDVTMMAAPPSRLERKKSSARVWVGETDVVSDAFLLTYEWRALRMRVLTKYGARCQCCGANPADGVRINVDHIKPRRLFPELALIESNLQVLCDVCNHGKGNWDQTDWRPAETVDALPEDWHHPLWWKAIQQ